MKITHKIILFIFLASVNAPCLETHFEELNATVTQVGTITDKKIDEASGIAASIKNKGIFWILNDSGNSPSLYALNSRGERIAKFKIKGVKNRDWEDIATFLYKGKAYILIADIGDNYAIHYKSRLHFIEEPYLKNKNKNKALKPAWSVKFQYEDGARDCESIAVDVAHKKILLLSKRDMPPVLYELPLKKGDKKEIAKKVGLFQSIPQPTAMDISADGYSAVVLTYKNAYYFHSLNAADWSKKLLTKPKEIKLPHLRQGEAICFDAVGKSIYITSEKIPAPLLKVELK